MIALRTVVAGLAAAVALVPAAARADTEYVADQQHDVVHYRFAGDDCRAAARRCRTVKSVDRRHRFGDIVWTRSAYFERRLVLTMKVRGSTTDGARATYVGWDVRRANGGEVGVQLLDSSGHLDVDLSTDEGDRCPAARGRVDRRRHVYTMTIPSGCVRNTAFVRVAASTLVTSDDSEWFDVAGVGSDVRIRYEVAERHYGRRVVRGPAGSARSAR